MLTKFSFLIIVGVLITPIHSTEAFASPCRSESDYSTALLELNRNGSLDSASGQAALARCRQEIDNPATPIPTYTYPTSTTPITLKGFVVYTKFDTDKVVIIDSSYKFYLVQYGYGCYSYDFSYAQTIYIDTYYKPSSTDDIYIGSSSLTKKCGISSSQDLNLKTFILSKDLGNSKANMTDSTGQKYLVDYGVGCLSLYRYEGSTIDIDLGGSLDGVGDTIYLFDSDDSCRVWDADRVNSFTTINPVSIVRQKGTNIKTPDGTIYMISSDGKKRPYTSAGAFLSYGFNTFQNVVDANFEESTLQTGSFIPPRDGKIICSDRGTDKGTCYLITDGKKAAITSAAVFKGLGFDFKNSTVGDVSWMESTTNIDNASAPHRKGVLINNNSTVLLVSVASVLGIPDIATFQSWGYTFADVVPANDTDKTLPQREVLKSRSAGELMP